MKRIVGAALLVLAIYAASVAISVAEPLTVGETSIEGVYSVSGSDYAGVATIRKFGDGYTMQMITATVDESGEATGSGSSLAIGLRDGNKITFSWHTKVQGLTHYTIGKDGVLSGRWLTIPGDGKTRPETLKRTGPLPKPAGGEDT